jgi:hypothetical protein
VRHGTRKYVANPSPHPAVEHERLPHAGYHRRALREDKVGSRCTGWRTARGLLKGGNSASSPSSASMRAKLVIRSTPSAWNAVR